jgi:hypothetical protein
MFRGIVSPLISLRDHPKIADHLVIDEAPLDILLEAAVWSPRMSTEERNKRIDLLQGPLDLLILRMLLLGPAHGRAIAKAIKFNSADVFQVEQGPGIPRCTASSSAATTQWKRAAQKTTAVQISIASPPRATGGSPPRPASRRRWLAPLHAVSGPPRRKVETQ